MHIDICYIIINKENFMLEILKSIGKGTSHEYSHDRFCPALPPRKSLTPNVNKTPNIIHCDSIWYDKMGVCYKLINNSLFISANDFLPETIVDYINSIPNNLNLNIIISINSRPNEVAGFNMLCNALSRIPSNKEITLNIGELRTGIGCSLEIENLPPNVKISNCIDIDKGKEERPFFGENSFDWWALHCDESNFKILLSKLTDSARVRAENLRRIAFNFYKFTPDSIKSANDEVKCKFAYEWCCANIQYDLEGTMPDGTLNYSRRDTQDPIVTFNKGKGICAGRASLLKLLLNNYYMKTPVFLVHGMAGRLQHVWNELITADGKSIFFDISKSKNLSRDIHDDYLLSKVYLDKKKTENIR